MNRRRKVGVEGGDFAAPFLIWRRILFTELPLMVIGFGAALFVQQMIGIRKTRRQGLEPFEVQMMSQCGRDQGCMIISCQ